MRSLKKKRLDGLYDLVRFERSLRAEHGSISLGKSSPLGIGRFRRIRKVSLSSAEGGNSGRWLILDAGQSHINGLRL
jgi:hypothetical protein